MWTVKYSYLTAGWRSRSAAAASVTMTTSTPVGKKKGTLGFVSPAGTFRCFGTLALIWIIKLFLLLTTFGVIILHKLQQRFNNSWWPLSPQETQSQRLQPRSARGEAFRHKSPKIVYSFPSDLNRKKAQHNFSVIFTTLLEAFLSDPSCLQLNPV